MGSGPNNDVCLSKLCRFNLLLVLVFLLALLTVKQIKLPYYQPHSSDIQSDSNLWKWMLPPRSGLNSRVRLNNVMCFHSLEIVKRTESCFWWNHEKPKHPNGKDEIMGDFFEDELGLQMTVFMLKSWAGEEENHRRKPGRRAVYNEERRKAERIKQ